MDEAPIKTFDIKPKEITEDMINMSLTSNNRQDLSMMQSQGLDIKSLVDKIVSERNTVTFEQHRTWARINLMGTQIIIHIDGAPMMYPFEIRYDSIVEFDMYGMFAAFYHIGLFSNEFLCTGEKKIMQRGLSELGDWASILSPSKEFDDVRSRMYLCLDQASYERLVERGMRYDFPNAAYKEYIERRKYIHLI